MIFYVLNKIESERELNRFFSKIQNELFSNALLFNLETNTWGQKKAHSLFSGAIMIMIHEERTKKCQIKSF